MSTAPAVLTAARQSLSFAKQGVEDYKAGGARRVSGLFNAATSGRTVTFVLQNMRGHVDGFDEWYEPIQAKLRGNPVAQWAKDLRNKVEKQGDPGPREGQFEIHNLDTRKLVAKAPAGTVGTILGDSWGRNYWVVRLADGTEENVYFDLAPESFSVQQIIFVDAPDGRDAADLLTEYVGILEEILASAEERFG